jgi:hypothetical protein
MRSQPLVPCQEANQQRFVFCSQPTLLIFPKKQLHARLLNHLALVGRDTVVQIEGQKLGHWFSTTTRQYR